MLSRSALASFFLLSAALGAELPSPKVLERYRQMLAANPVEGTALERLWKAHADASRTAELLAQYPSGGGFGSEMVLGHLLRRAGRDDDAAAAFQRAAELQPGSALPPLALADLASVRAQHREAAAWLEKALAAVEADATAPRVEGRDVPAILMKLGAAHLAAGDLEKAALAWERTAALAPTDLELRRRLAAAYAQNHLGDRAIPHLDFLKTHAPPAERALALQQLARIHEGAGRADEAATALEAALALTAPGNWLRGELQSHLIRLHQRHHRVAELQERWEKRAAANPRDAGALLQLADLFERLGELEPQRAALEKLVALAPKNADHRLRLARLHARLDQLDPAAALYDALLAQQPADADLVFERARLDLQRDAAPAARQRIAALLSAQKDDDSLRGRALEFFETNRLHEAVEEHLTADARGGADEPILALANFQFTQRRPAEARRTLQRLVRNDAAPADRAAAHAGIAQALKAQGDLAGAAVAIADALKLQPEARDFHLLLGELESAQARYPAARAAFEKAFALSRTPAEALDVDQKLFDAVRSDAPPAPGQSRFIMRSDAGQSLSTPALQDALLALTRAAAATPSVEGWLRVARWHLWSRNPRIAHECAQHALALDARSVATYEFLLKIAAAESQPPRAVAHLRELMKIDPAGRAGYLRRLAQVELAAGRAEEALRILGDLARENPGSLEALQELALAQQRAEAWPAALATCRQVYALSPPSRKKEAAAALLHVLERMHLPREAAQLLLEQLDAQPDDKDRFPLFADLLAHCAKRGLLDWLRAEFEQRRKLRADDYFTAMALGRTLKAAGEKAAAFDLLADASLAAPNPAEALPELIREAEDLRKLDAAIRLQAQLVKITPQPRAEAYEKLAQLHERNFAVEEAARIWEKIALKFPRDATALQRAAEFELKWGSPARATALLRRIRALEPANLRALAALADLHLEAGAAAEAEACLEEILRFAPPQKDAAIRIPGWKAEDPGRLQNAYLTTVRQRRGRPNTEAMRALRSFWVEEQSGVKSDADLRLGVIRKLGQLVLAKADAAALPRWIARWNAPPAAASETLWALYFSGAHAALLDHVERLMTRTGADAQLTQAFLFLALQTGELDRLAVWLRDRRRTPTERDYLLVALGQHLASGGRLEPAQLARLFPEGFRSRLWQAAALFANRAHFREAAQLGQRVFDGLPSQRAGYGLDLAHWHLRLGDIDAARRVLRAALDQPGEGFDSPVYAALRESWLLLPREERPGFTSAFLASLDPRAEPLHAAISGALLHGLAGDAAFAQQHLRRVLELGAMAQISAEDGGNSAARLWEFILTAGAQMQAWRLDALAIFFWENAVADPALIRLQAQAQGEQVQARAAEVRTRLAALKIAGADAFEREELLAAFTRTAGGDGLVTLAEALETLGATARTIEIHRTLWEREPANPHALRNLLAACRTGGDLETLEAVLARCLRDGIFQATDAAHRDLASQFVELLEKRGDGAQAGAILTEALERAPRDGRLLLRFAQLQERAGQAAAAETLYRRLLSSEPANAAARVALATLLDGHGKGAEAIELLEKSAGLEVEAKLAHLHLKGGRRDEALSALDRLPPGAHIAPSLLAADTLAAAGDAKAALIVLRNASSRGADPRANLPLQSRIIELLPPAEDRAVVAREWRRLRQLAGDDLHLLGGYYDLLLRQAPRLGWEKEAAAELREDWEEGDGLLAAGAALLESRVRAGDAAAAQTLGERLLGRRDLTDGIAQTVSALAELKKHPALAILARERLARLNPLENSRMFDWAQALHAAGRRAEGMKVLQELGWRTVLHDELPAQLAETYVAWGEPALAREFFEQAVAADPAARQPRAHLGFARLRTAEGDHAGARKLLRAAFRNPANREFGELVAHLAASGRLERFEQDLVEFALEPSRAVAARRALFAHWEKERQLVRAAALLGAHPEIIEPGLLARLRALATAASDFEPIAAALEQLRLQVSQSGAVIDPELAALYSDWAEADLRALQADAALAHLQRGHTLQPALFKIARRLSELHLERGAPKLAIQALEAFLAASLSDAEKETARQLLARIRS